MHQEPGTPQLEPEKTLFAVVLDCCQETLLSHILPDLHPLIELHLFHCKATGSPRPILANFLDRPTLKKSYHFRSTFGSKGKDNGQFNYPRAVALSTTSGNLFVADKTNHRYITSLPFLIISGSKYSLEKEPTSTILGRRVRALGTLMLLPHWLLISKATSLLWILVSPKNVLLLP